MNFKSRLHEFAFFPFLLPVFFVLHTSRYFYGSVPFAGALEVTGLYCLITAAIYLVVRKCSKYSVGAGLATMLIMSLFIYWGEIIKRVNKVLNTENYTHLPVVLILWVVIALLLGKLLNRQSLSTRSKATFYFNALFLLYLVFEAGMMGFEAWKTRNAPPLMVLTDTQVDKQIVPVIAPNVYLLLLDEYSSSSSLKQEWGFDNTAIDSSLKSRNFIVNSNSRSNYQMTFFSMATMLNMDYLDTVFEQKEIEFTDYPKSQKWLYHPRVVKNFLQAGYTFHNLSIFEIEGQPKPELRDILVDHRDLLTVNNFYHVLNKYYVPYLKNRQAIKSDPNFKDPTFYYLDIYNKKRVQEVVEEAGRKRSKPKFIYAHIESPHFPFYYDSLGNYLPPSIAKSTIAHKSVPLYLNSVRQTNRMILQMVDSIQKHEQGKAVILVMSDHGFRPQQKTKNIDELYRNYSAFYFPDHNYSSVPDSITNVNVFRVLFNKMFGTNYPLLRNKCVELGKEEKINHFF